MHTLRLDHWSPDNRLDHRPRIKNTLATLSLSLLEIARQIDSRASRSFSPLINLSRSAYRLKAAFIKCQFWSRSIEQCTFQLVPPATRLPWRRQQRLILETAVQIEIYLANTSLSYSFGVAVRWIRPTTRFGLGRAHFPSRLCYRKLCESIGRRLGALRET